MAAKQTAVIFLPLAAVIIFFRTLQVTQCRKLRWSDVGRGVAKLGLIGAVAIGSVIDLVAGAIPGIRDILVLGKVKQLEQARVADAVTRDLLDEGTLANGRLVLTRRGRLLADAVIRDLLD